jgi:hypothetical protein
MSNENKPKLPQSEYLLAIPDQPYDPGFTTMETGYSEGDMHAFREEGVAAERERLCAAIKAADDQSIDEAGYMLDSDDCINVIRGTWKPSTTTYGREA